MVICCFYFVFNTSVIIPEILIVFIPFIYKPENRIKKEKETLQTSGFLVHTKKKEILYCL